MKFGSSLGPFASTSALALGVVLAFSTGCGTLGKAGVPNVSDATKAATSSLPKGVGDVAAAAADGKMPDAKSLAGAAADIAGDKIPGGKAIAQGIGVASDVAHGKAPDVGTVAALAGDKVPGAKTVAAIANGKVPAAAAPIAQVAQAAKVPAASSVAAAVPVASNASSGSPKIAPTPTSNAAPSAAPSTLPGDDAASFLGTSADGWTPRGLSALYRGMKPRAVGAIFPGAENVDSGFSESRVDDGRLVAKYRFFFELTPGGGRALRDVTIYFDRAHRSQTFYTQLTAATQRKYGAVDPADARRGSVLWVGADGSIAQLTRDKQGSCALQVDLAR